MKNINKKLYLVIVVCLLLLCFSLNVLATESSNVSTNISSLPESGETSSGDGEGAASGNESDYLEGDESTSSDLTDVSSGEEDLSSTDSNLSDGSGTESESSDQSDASDVSSDEASSKKSSSQGNVGGYINDEADTSGWGGGTDFTSSRLTSAGTTEKKDNKNITNYSALLWILIWIPVLLIFASIGALVYVNRKAFLKQDTSFANTNNVYSPKRRKISAAERAKLKNNHKNRTNIYRPRD